MNRDVKITAEQLRQAVHSDMEKLLDEVTGAVNTRTLDERRQCFRTCRGPWRVLLDCRCRRRRPRPVSRNHHGGPALWCQCSLLAEEIDGSPINRHMNRRPEDMQSFPRPFSRHVRLCRGVDRGCARNAGAVPGGDHCHYATVWVSHRRRSARSRRHTADHPRNCWTWCACRFALALIALTRGRRETLHRPGPRHGFAPPFTNVTVLTPSPRAAKPSGPVGYERININGTPHLLDAAPRVSFHRASGFAVGWARVGVDPDAQRPAYEEA